MYAAMSCTLISRDASQQEIGFEKLDTISLQGFRQSLVEYVLVL